MVHNNRSVYIPISHFYQFTSIIIVIKYRHHRRRCNWFMRQTHSGENNGTEKRGFAYKSDSERREEMQSVWK